MNIEQHTFKKFTAIAACVLFFCMVSNISSAAPLLILSTLGVIAVLCGRLPIFTTYGATGLLFVLLLIAHYIFLDSPLGLVHTLCFSFLSGYAFYHSREAGALESVTRYLPAMLLLSLAVFLPYSAYSGKLESTFWDARFRWLFITPNYLGFMAATVVIVAAVHLRLPQNNKQTSADKNILPAQAGVGQNEKVGQSKPIGWMEWSNTAMDRLFTFLGSRLVMLAGGLAALLMLIAAGSRSSLFTCAMVIVFLYAKPMFYNKKLRRVVLAGLLALLTIYVALVSLPATKERFYAHSPARMLEIFVHPLSDPTFNARRPMWESAWQAFLQKPLIGNGLGSYPEFHIKYVLENRRRFDSMLGSSLVYVDTLEQWHAHNQWLMLMAETGLAGTLLFAALYLTPLAYCLRRRTALGIMLPLLAYYFVVMLFEAPLFGQPTCLMLMPLFAAFACMLGHKKQADPS